MICCACRALNVKTTKNGLCSACKRRAAGTTTMRRMRRTAAALWVEGDNAVLLSRYGMTHREAIERAVLLRLQLLHEFDARAITINGLDNPYMQDHARRTMIASARRMQEAHDIGRGMRRPVASATAIPATRKKAA